MTNEEAIRYFKRHIDLYCVDGISREAEEMAIKALEQQPITTTNNDEPITVIYPTTVCDDAISREMALEKMADYVASGYADSAEDFEEYSKIICQLPPVTPQQKYGKWIKHPEIETSTPEYLMFYECSECGDKQCFCKSDIHKKRFCSNCGARMESEDKE